MITKDRHNLGNSKVLHKNVVTRSVVGISTYDNLVVQSDFMFNYDVGFIPAGVEHRPDLISNIFYNTPSYWWLLMLVNNVADPFEDFNVGDRILLPKI